MGDANDLKARVGITAANVYFWLDLWSEDLDVITSIIEDCVLLLLSSHDNSRGLFLVFLSSYFHKTK
ncbi:unnamed protein product [Arabidopsis thaliana]|uniref:Uncharacterized protein n=1 Tax=Arabidopsis thaliana TaxID=3702 RepID=A0A5S9XJ58_ARATH|nr:unnamed protein product [Arabidopsis thaliana]